MAEIYLANTSIFGVQKVKVNMDSIKSRNRHTVAVCPLCGEGYPLGDGKTCLSCQGKAPYLDILKCRDRRRFDHVIEEHNLRVVRQLLRP